MGHTSGDEWGIWACESVLRRDLWAEESSGIVSREEESAKQRCGWRERRETWGDLIKGTWDLLEGGRSSLPQAAKGLL